MRMGVLRSPAALLRAFVFHIVDSATKNGIPAKTTQARISNPCMLQVNAIRFVVLLSLSWRPT
jgi:hypothetical protein